MDALKVKTTCYHCGEDCDKDHPIVAEEKSFCCEGCRLVYELLSENQLCTYYNFEANPGNTPLQSDQSNRFAFLNDANLKASLIDFSNGNQTHITFFIPGMHCSSCIYLLEHLDRLCPGVVHAQVHFPEKKLKVIFNEPETRLIKIVEMMARIGYEPYFSLDDISRKKQLKRNNSRIYKIGIAGFAFGNVMMLSLPEYFAMGEFFDEKGLESWFGFLNILLAIPVFFYSASEFFISGYKSLRKGFLNIDLPIALAILMTFGRSIYEIVSGTGAGYMDSMTGIVFFMLVGRFFQDKTYDTLSFDRDYKSYFPISVSVRKSGIEQTVPLTELRTGDRMIIRNNEIIPADALLLKGEANIDYSFVTGESNEIKKEAGELIFAGGKQIGTMIELEVVKEVAQSYLTSLWNRDAFEEKEQREQSFIHYVSKYFTLILFIISATSFIYWAPIDMKRGIDAITTILIIACPCTLLLSSTFTFGNVLHYFSKQKVYLKNSDVIEMMTKVDTIVFDKTGTLTEANQFRLEYEGAALTQEEKRFVKSLATQSSHPLSRRINHFLEEEKIIKADNFRENIGEGLKGVFEGNEVYLGSYNYVGSPQELSHSNETSVYVRINDHTKGRFIFKNVYRPGLEQLVKRLKPKYGLMILSGDNDSEKNNLEKMLGKAVALYFNQSPDDKLKRVESLQQSGKYVMMIGDGLNDAGALKQSDVGMVIADRVNNFSPACDVIMESSSLHYLDRLIQYSFAGKRIVKISFGFSLLYNVAGLSFAVQGLLSPVIAAILMPSSSITIIALTSLSNMFAARKLFKKPMN